MNILISYDKEPIPVSLSSGQSIALYGVPTEYSDDGLYLAQWGDEELEPLPACGAWALLLRLSLSSQGNGEEELVENFRADGVNYAQN